MLFHPVFRFVVQQVIQRYPVLARPVVVERLWDHASDRETGIHPGLDRRCIRAEDQVVPHGLIAEPPCLDE